MQPEDGGLTPHPEQASELDFGALPEVARQAVLPEDTTDESFRHGVRGLRKFFAQRSDYNAFICTLLAQRRIVPNATLVLDIGGWGSKNDVLEDVKTWFAALAQRQLGPTLEVPAPFLTAARELMERMWHMAAQQAQQHIAYEREKARSAFSEMQSALLHKDSRIKGLEEEVARRAQEVADLTARLEAEAARAEQIQARISALESELEQNEQRHTARERELHEQHARALQEVAQRLQAEQQRHASETASLRTQMREQVEQLAQRCSSLEADLKARIAEVDRARQEALGFSRQALQLQQEMLQVRAQIADVQIDKARLEKDLQVARAEAAAWKEKAAELEAAAIQKENETASEQAPEQTKPRRKKRGA